MKLWPTAQGPFRAPSLCTICRASMKNSSVTKLLFCSLPGTKAHTLWSNGHSYRMWCVVSSCCPQKEHFGSICTFCWARLDFVGRTLQHTLHIKVLTFGGTFRDHSFFHKCWSWEAEECSPEHDWLSRRATWYAVFTVNSRDLFSFHVNLSLVFDVPTLILRMSSTVARVKVAARILQSHWWLTSLIKSHTFKSWSAPSLNRGRCGSHLWVLMPMEKYSQLKRFFILFFIFYFLFYFIFLWLRNMYDIYKYFIHS